MTGETMWEVEHVFGIKESAAEKCAGGKSYKKDIFPEKKSRKNCGEKISRRGRKSITDIV